MNSPTKTTLSTKAPVPITPSSSSQPIKGLSQLVLTPRRPLIRPQTSPTSKAPVPTTASSSQPTEDVFDSDVDENVEEPIDEDLESDSDDNDFKGDELEEFDGVSLDEESDENEVFDELALEVKIEQKMTLGYEDADGNLGHVIVRKHICGRTEANKSVSSRWVATHLLPYYTANLNATVENMEDIIITKYKGVLMTAIGLDGNNGLNHKKNKEEWSCFLEDLVSALDARKNSSTIPLCLIDTSFEKSHALSIKKDMCALFYKNYAANCPEHWARFKFNVKLKSDDNINNFVESFNNAITKRRGKPMLTILQEIKKLNASYWEGKVTPFVEKKLSLIEEESKNCLSVVNAGKGEFDVVEDRTNFTVKLRDQFCDCKRWQITSLPYKDSARCILRMKGKLENYCAPWFSTENYRKLYDNIIHPISDPCICKQCKQLGHNSLTYGRPRDDTGRLMERYKRKKKTSSRLVRRPRKSYRATLGRLAKTSARTSIATVAPPTQSSQALFYVNLFYYACKMHNLL
ncbi:hypothetical protein Cgig2_004627 [Carnegiea gigantea]|uniref:Uncharacterized protein n=1 Tax=Carnegiea gigantea TaxID=171969 RepID=A0A9Q1JTJ4_9CARY|nr:hypothetical protein Cgig2_004627 [Carnegiea gigantea]